jgi:pimeloyl-ACP methyl ester carboxylesterase
MFGVTCDPVINPRRYGSAPFRVAVIHGGPGVAGEMAAVAEVLCSERGVLEPLQTEGSLWAQVEELKGQLQECSKPPLTLIGFSWGAWLSLILAAQYPHLVSRLVLIGCGPLEEKYVHKIMDTRLSRLGGAEREEAKSILAALEDESLAVDEAKNKKMNRAMARMGELFRKTDAFDPMECRSIQSDLAACGSILPKFGCDDSNAQLDSDIYQAVWQEASLLRQKGELLDLCKKVQCPVTAIHGDYDPHPPEGVREPLKDVLKSFRFILLENCGHKPWIEKMARGKFYTILREVLNQDLQLQ